MDWVKTPPPPLRKNSITNPLFFRMASLTPYCELLDQSWWPQIVSTWQIHRRKSHCITFIYLVPDDSWYLGLALSFGIMSKALTVEGIWQFKGFFFYKIITWKFRNFGLGQIDVLGWLATMYLSSRNYLGPSRLVQELTVGCYIG